MAALEAGTKAPVFSLRDIEGKAHSLRELHSGDLALLIFYHRECPVCQFSAQFFAIMANKIKSSCVAIWGISQDAEDESEEFANERGLTMPILIDAPHYAVSNAYGVTNVPTLFVIEGGKIVKNCVGFSRDDFTEIAAMLARKAGVAPPDLFAGRKDIPAVRPG
jgi:peroxiredoxin